MIIWVIKIIRTAGTISSKQNCLRCKSLQRVRIIPKPNFSKSRPEKVPVCWLTGNILATFSSLSKWQRAIWFTSDQIALISFSATGQTPEIHANAAIFSGPLEVMCILSVFVAILLILLHKTLNWLSSIWLIFYEMCIKSWIFQNIPFSPSFSGKQHHICCKLPESIHCILPINGFG